MGVRLRKDVATPRKFYDEFQHDVVASARHGGPMRADVAADFRVSESTLNQWLAQAGIDDGVKDDLTSAEQNEIVRLRRKNRRLEMENETLRCAAE